MNICNDDNESGRDIDIINGSERRDICVRNDTDGERCYQIG